MRRSCCCGWGCLPSCRYESWPARQPFAFGIGFLCVAVAAKFAVPLFWNIGQPQIFTMPDVLYLAVLGWCIHFAGSATSRLVVLGIAVLLFPLLAYTGGNWTGSWIKFMLVLAAVAALLYAPRVRLWRWLVLAVLPISAAGYHIYLFHRIIPELLLLQPDPANLQPWPAVLAIVIGILSGLAVHMIQGKAIAWLASRRHAIQPRQGPLRQTVETPAA